MPAYEHTITAQQQGMRLDAALAQCEGVLSRAEAVRLIEAGTVTLNGTQITAKKRIVIAGDMLAYQTVDIAPHDLTGEHITLDIRFEDEHLIVLSKQAGLVVHPSVGHPDGTLVNALIAHCGYDGLAKMQGEYRPGIVHRLDKDTSGLMLVAKTNQVAELLQDGIRSRNIDRRYLALVHGYIAPDTGMVDAPIARGETHRKRMMVSDRIDARPSITTFTVLERFEAGVHDDGYTLLECKLYTGRTHQIRVHMRYIEHPCVGDTLYGNNKPKAQLGLQRQFLHSYKLDFLHPITGEEQAFQDSLPPDLAAALDAVKDRAV